LGLQDGGVIQLQQKICGHGVPAKGMPLGFQVVIEAPAGGTLELFGARRSALGFKRAPIKGQGGGIAKLK
jgi:hypothetical protein